MQFKKLFIGIAAIIVPFGSMAIFMTVDGNTFPQLRFIPLAKTIDAETIRFKMDRVNLGQSGLSLSSPNEFTRLTQNSRVTPVVQATEITMLQSESFQYTNNGVIINIDYLTYANDTRISLREIRAQYKKDLVRLKQNQNVVYKLNTIERSGIEGLLVDAEYPVQHLDKTQRYEVLTFVLLNQLWRVTAKYKDCNPKGQALVKWMLASIQITT